MILRVRIKYITLDAGQTLSMSVLMLSMTVRKGALMGNKSLSF
jgi:hypothetical protein